jgi:hypothetical protein
MSVEREREKERERERERERETPTLAYPHEHPPSKVFRARGGVLLDLLLRSSRAVFDRNTQS